MDRYKEKCDEVVQKEKEDAKDRVNLNNKRLENELQFTMKER